MRPIELDEKGWPTKEWLEWAYLEQGLNTYEIAKMAGRAVSKINVRMHRYDIPIRKPIAVDREWLEQKYVVERLPIKEIAVLAGTKPSRISFLVRQYDFPAKRPIQRKFRPTREWVIQKYVVEGLSTKQICELTGYSRGGFGTLLESYGIQAKGWSKPKLDVSKEELYQLHVVEGLTAVRIAQRYGCHNSAISRLIKEYDLDPGRPLVNVRKQPPISANELQELYWTQQISISDIAGRYHVAPQTANRWFKILQVPTRKWNGGDFKRTYKRSQTPDNRFGKEFSAQERDKVLTRDQWRCQMPGCACSEAWKLEVHHILPVEYDGDNSLSNGITLCKSCHDSIRRRELELIPLFSSLVNQSVAHMQTYCIGETPENQVNTEGTLVIGTP